MGGIQGGPFDGLESVAELAGQGYPQLLRVDVVLAPGRLTAAIGSQYRLTPDQLRYAAATVIAAALSSVPGQRDEVLALADEIGRTLTAYRSPGAPS